LEESVAAQRSLPTTPNPEEPKKRQQKLAFFLMEIDSFTMFKLEVNHYSYLVYLYRLEVPGKYAEIKIQNSSIYHAH
jgi:hypothetical protein